jgi:hypothetical protein
MIDVDLEGALSLLAITLRAYQDRLEKEGESHEADLIRSQFAGAKFMVEALCGPEVKRRLLRQLREKGLKIPHCGPRVGEKRIGFMADWDEGYLGWDSDADMLAFKRVSLPKVRVGLQTTPPAQPSPGAFRRRSRVGTGASRRSPGFISCGSSVAEVLGAGGYYGALIPAARSKKALKSGVLCIFAAPNTSLQPTFNQRVPGSSPGRLIQIHEFIRFSCMTGKFRCRSRSSARS